MGSHDSKWRLSCSKGWNGCCRNDLHESFDYRLISIHSNWDWWDRSDVSHRSSLLLSTIVCMLDWYCNRESVFQHDEWWCASTLHEATPQTQTKDISNLQAENPSLQSHSRSIATNTVPRWSTRSNLRSRWKIRWLVTKRPHWKWAVVRWLECTYSVCPNQIANLLVVRWTRLEPGFERR